MPHIFQTFGANQLAKLFPAGVAGGAAEGIDANSDAIEAALNARAKLSGDNTFAGNLSVADTFTLSATDFNCGGTSIGDDGTFVCPSGGYIGSLTVGGLMYQGGPETYGSIVLADPTSPKIAMDSASIQLGSGLSLAWSSTATFNGTKDVGLIRSAANTLKVTNGSSGFGNLSIAALTATQRVTSGVVALTAGATPALDASAGNTFTLTVSNATANTIAAPSNAVTGQRILILFSASGADRTLALNTGAGGFAYGSDITGLSATVNGRTDLIGAIYNGTKWFVCAYVKGYY